MISGIHSSFAAGTDSSWLKFRDRVWILGSSLVAGPFPPATILLSSGFLSGHWIAAHLFPVQRVMADEGFAAGTDS